MEGQKGVRHQPNFNNYRVSMVSDTNIDPGSIFRDLNGSYSEIKPWVKKF
jgi:hypothetical protein